ncbi:hypothetical protein TWF696_000105 [Orbilia brochopaga]|uniref:Uncharacterized protein n=1 Tax=Orbilia brochopaga TaxID=3140254 RepID=A0AAV9VCT2_9PEZI
MPAGRCLHRINGDTLAQVCNYSSGNLTVTQKEVFSALDRLRSDCGTKEFSGQMKRQSDGLSAYLYGIGGYASKINLPGKGNRVQAKRQNIQDASYENDVLTIKLDRPLDTKEEYDQLVAEILLEKRIDNGTNSATREDSAEIEFEKQARKADPCDIKYPNFPSDPILGCNRKPLDKDGRCPKECHGIHIGHEPSFCETQRRFLYGAEQQYNVEPIINGPGSPERNLVVGVSVTYGISYNINFGFDIPETTLKLGLGVTVSYTTTHTVTNAFTATKASMNGYCGYFTFIPKMVESCGTLTNWRGRSLKGKNPVEILGSSKVIDNKDVKPHESVNGVCVIHPFLKESGEADGITVIVLTDCTKQHILAPMSEQNIAYQYPGVAKISPADHELAPEDNP